MNMKKIYMLACVMLLTSPFIATTVFAGDENNPEMKDDTGDVLLFENKISPVINMLFKNMDIISVWFYELSDEPDNLYVCLKMNDLRWPIFLGQYVAAWEYNGTMFGCGVRIHSKGDYFEEIIAYLDDYGEHIDIVPGIVKDFNLDTHIITFCVPKEEIGNPQAGSKLNNFYSNVMLRTLDERPVNGVYNILVDRAFEGLKTYTVQY